MNVQTQIDKLLLALSIRGKKYKVNSYMFYSDRIEKYCNKYILSRKELVPMINIFTGEEEGQEEKYVQVLDTYNRLDILKYLIKEYKGSEENDRETEEIH